MDEEAEAEHKVRAVMFGNPKYESHGDTAGQRVFGVVSNNCVSWCRSQVQIAFGLGHCILLDYATYHVNDLCYVKL